MLPTRIRAIVFDFGGVLMDWNPRYLYRKLFPGDDTAMERFLAEIGFTEWNQQQDAGRAFSLAVTEPISSTHMTSDGRNPSPGRCKGRSTYCCRCSKPDWSCMG